MCQVKNAHTVIFFHIMILPNRTASDWQSPDTDNLRVYAHRPPPRITVKGGCIHRIKWGNAYIRQEQAQNAYHAYTHAWNTGKPFNVMVTINTGNADIQHIRTKICKAYRKYIQWHHRGNYAYIWVFECGDTIGQHMHLFLHIPSTPSLYKSTKKHLQKALRTLGIDTKEYRNGVSRQVEFTQIKTNRPDGTPNAHPSLGILQYINKGGNHTALDNANDNTAHRFINTLQSKNQGVFYCQRIGVSRNIDESARTKYAEQALPTGRHTDGAYNANTAHGKDNTTAIIQGDSPPINGTDSTPELLARTQGAKTQGIHTHKANNAPKRMTSELLALIQRIKNKNNDPPP